MKLKKLYMPIAMLVLSLVLIGCQRSENGDPEKESNANISSEEESEVRSETESEELENVISQEKIEWFETVFFNDDENLIVNFFLSSEYDTVADIDLGNLFHNGDDGLGGTGELSDEEITLAINHFNMDNLDVSKARKNDMDVILQKYTGLTLEDTNKVGLEKLFYVEEKDAYYKVAGDTEYMKCDIIKGWVNEDGTITLQYCDALSSISDIYEVTLKEVGDSYQFVSNKLLDRENK